VVTTPFSFFATAGCIARLRRARCSPTSSRTPSTWIRPRGRGLRPAHPGGDRGRTCSGGPRPPAGEVPGGGDAAQAVGGRGTDACACYSFFPSKNLGGFGTPAPWPPTTTPRRSARACCAPTASRPKYVHHAVGGNFRLDTLQAALLRVKLPHLARWTAARRANADRYRRCSRTTPASRPSCAARRRPRHIYNQFVIRRPTATAAAFLAESAWPPRSTTRSLPPAALLPRSGLSRGAFPQAEAAAREALALPIYPELTEAQQAHVVSRIAAFYATAAPEEPNMIKIAVVGTGGWGINHVRAFARPATAAGGGGRSARRRRSTAPPAFAPARARCAGSTRCWPRPYVDAVVRPPRLGPRRPPARQALRVPQSHFLRREAPGPCRRRRRGGGARRA
jgi:hypothetical protein